MGIARVLRWRSVRPLALAVCIGLAAAGCTGGTSEPETTLVLTSTPVDGVEVTIGGEVRGTTPLTIQGQPPGNVYVLARKEGFKDEGSSILLQEGRVAELEIEMRPRVGLLSLDSTPPGAEVVIDGEVIGQTPLNRYPLALGEHTYTLELDKHEIAEKTFVVEEDFHYPFRHNLTPKQAQLTVITRPSRARVWINDQPEAERSPVRTVMSPGIHVIGAQTRGYMLSEETIELAPAEERELIIELEPGDVPVGMMLVPEGEFIMGQDDGAPDERPARTIRLAAFYIDRYEVTNEAFAQVFPDHQYQPGQERMPVTGVSYMQAAEYAERVGKRLPTEAEWEKAARGTDGRVFPWGDTWDQEKANTLENEDNVPKRVGSYRLGASPYGVLDMAGNVHEWVQDWYEAYPGNTDVTKDYGQVYRVLRGGSFTTSRYEARAARRHFDRMDSSRADYGFRCAQDAVE